MEYEGMSWDVVANGINGARGINGSAAGTGAGAPGAAAGASKRGVMVVPGA